jgi:hypothetical protein
VKWSFLLNSEITLFQRYLYNKIHTCIHSIFKLFWIVMQNNNNKNITKQKNQQK